MRISADSASSAVGLSGLRKSFGAVTAVDGVDLSVAAGEIVALLGPNGAGKSTLIDMLLGLMRPERGEIFIFGEVPADAVAQGRVGAMLQGGSLPSHLSVREVVTLVRSLYPDPLSADEVLAQARIADLAHRRANQLSGGQTQRVRFALALVPDPDLLVLDEPTAAMDVESRQAFWSAMREWASAGRTVLFATHHLDEADAFADRVILLRNGRVVADGAISEVKALAGARTIRCTLAADASLVPRLSAVPGVSEVSVHGDTVTLRCSDSDATLRALVTDWPEAHDFEISGASLHDAFFALTTDRPESNRLDRPGK